MSLHLLARACALALLCANLASTSWADEQELFVATTGNDAQPGTPDQPLASLQGAQRRIRELRESSPNDPIRVTIADGDYYLAEPLEFTAAESGTAQAPVLITAAQNANVRLIGGREINGFQPVTESEILARLTSDAQKQTLVANLPEYGIKDFGELLARGHDHALHPAGIEVYFRGAPTQLARWPNEGWSTVTQSIHKDDQTRIQYHGDRPRSWKTAEGAWAHGFWEADWSDAWQPVRAADAANHTFTIERTENITDVRDGARFCLLNALEELDQPGEWYLERSSGNLYFWPPAEVKRDDVVVSLLEHPLSLYDVSHFTIRDVTIEAARVCLVEVVRGEHVTIENCTLRNAGNLAVHVFGGTNHRVTNCDIHHTGEGGLRIEGGDRATLTPANHSIENNSIHDFARTCHAWRPAIAAHGVGIRIANNHIHQGPDGAIVLEGNDHLVERNEIDHVCLLTADVGAIYLGHDWTERGHIIRHNYLHHLGQFNRRDVMGVYLDDFASGATVQGNVFVDAGRGVVIGGGRDNTIDNNLFVDGAAGVQADARGLTWAKQYASGEQSPLVQRLVAMPIDSEPYRTRYPELAKLLADQATMPKGNRIERNVFRCQITIDLHDPATEQEVAVRDNWSGRDPHFVDANRGDYRLREDSPAFKLGFQPIPWQQIGRQLPSDSQRVVAAPTPQ